MSRVPELPECRIPDAMEICFAIRQYILIRPLIIVYAVFIGTLQLIASSAIAIRCRLSSVCLPAVSLSSVTRVYCDKIAEARIMQF